jgi:hypothetical protein
MSNEKRLIDANALLKEHCGDCSLAQQKMCENDPVCGSAMWIVEAPTVDAVEVVHGRWNEINQIATGLPWKYRCNECGCPQDYKHNYCPNCGAKMDGGDGT